MEEREYNLRMIKTRFVTECLDELVELMMDFEEKLTMWSNDNTTATWDVKVYIGDYEYVIEVIVEDDTDEKET
jgi:hypothetical protein